MIIRVVLSSFKLNFFSSKNIKTVSTLDEIDNTKVVYKHIRKEGTNGVRSVSIKQSKQDS